MLLYHIVPYDMVPYHMVPYHAVPYHAVPYHIILYISYTNYFPSCKLRPSAPIYHIGTSIKSTICLYHIPIITYCKLTLYKILVVFQDKFYFSIAHCTYLQYTQHVMELPLPAFITYKGSDLLCEVVAPCY